MPVAARLSAFCAILLAIAGISLAGGFSPEVSGATPFNCKGSRCAPIKHVIVIIRENHSFDSLFGRMSGVNGSTHAHVGKKRIKVGVTPDPLRRDLSHGPAQAAAAMNGGKMNRFFQQAGAIQNGIDVADSEYTQQQIPGYWALAERYGIADDFFSTMIGDSFPNHLVLISGTNQQVITNPSGPKLNTLTPWGCDAPSGVNVVVYNKKHQFVKKPPCFNVKTLADEANAAGVSWKYYAAPAGTPGYIWSTFDAIKPIRNSAQWTNNVATPTQFDSDVQNGTLPSISWLTADWKYSDHPPASICSGENWTVSKIDEVMKSPLWSSTAIILLWDDYGGFYDQVRPQLESKYSLGPRVPMILISPYVIRHSVYRGQMDFRSVVVFIENQFGLPHIDSFYRHVNSVAQMIDPHQSPLAPLILKQKSGCPSGGGSPY